jgi:hypothetical protein
MREGAMKSPTRILREKICIFCPGHGVIMCVLHKLVVYIQLEGTRWPPHLTRGGGGVGGVDIVTAPCCVMSVWHSLSLSLSLTLLLSLCGHKAWQTCVIFTHLFWSIFFEIFWWAFESLSTFLKNRPDSKSLGKCRKY